jgi:hypothetical protein
MNRAPIKAFIELNKHVTGRRMPWTVNSNIITSNKFMFLRKCLKTLLALSEGYRWLFVLVMQMSAKMSPTNNKNRISFADCHPNFQWTSGKCYWWHLQLAGWPLQLCAWDWEGAGWLLQLCDWVGEVHLVCGRRAGRDYAAGRCSCARETEMELAGRLAKCGRGRCRAPLLRLEGEPGRAGWRRGSWGELASQSQ